jgi:CheY-like chemotaxis protein
MLTFKDRFEGFTLLIAEDNEENFHYLRIACERIGFKVIRAKTGADAIRICDENSNICLILMDGLMPEMTGYEAAGKIRKNHPGLPIILLTAFVSQASIFNAIASGCNDYMAKPIGVKELYMAIKKWVVKPN